MCQVKEKAPLVALHQRQFWYITHHGQWEIYIKGLSGARHKENDSECTFRTAQQQLLQCRSDCNTNIKHSTTVYARILAHKSPSLVSFAQGTSKSETVCNPSTSYCVVVGNSDSKATSGKTMMVLVMCHIVLWLCERKRRGDTAWWYTSSQILLFGADSIGIFHTLQYLLRLTIQNSSSWMVYLKSVLLFLSSIPLLLRHPIYPGLH